MFRQILTHVLFLSLSTVFVVNINAQASLSMDGSAPRPSAMMDIKSPDKGVLIPRIALTASNSASPVISPDTSLLVYNTATAGTAPNQVIPGYYYWNGASWIHLLAGSLDFPFTATVPIAVL